MGPFGVREGLEVMAGRSWLWNGTTVKEGQGEVGSELVDRMSLRLRLPLQLGRSVPHQG